MKRAWVGSWGTAILAILQHMFLDAKMSLG